MLIKTIARDLAGAAFARAAPALCALLMRAETAVSGSDSIHNEVAC
jgi:hypothetical protein